MIIPGEDRDWGGEILYIDLIPSTCWFTNVRSVLPQKEWQDLAVKIRERDGFPQAEEADYMASESTLDGALARYRLTLKKMIQTSSKT